MRPSNTRSDENVTSGIAGSRAGPRQNLGADGVLAEAGLRLALRLGDADIAGRIDHRPGPLTAEGLRDALRVRDIHVPARQEGRGRGRARHRSARRRGPRVPVAPVIRSCRGDPTRRHAFDRRAGGAVEPGVPLPPAGPVEHRMVEASRCGRGTRPLARVPSAAAPDRAHRRDPARSSRRGGSGGCSSRRCRTATRP